MTGTFAAPVGSEWVRVSPRLRSLRRTVLVTVTAPVVAAAVAALAWSGDAPWAAGVVAAAGAGGIAGGWVSIGRNWRSWGFVERADELIVVRGSLFTRLVVVPYGRMQLVDVVAGPLERVFGVVTVKLHTAAATTDARVRGLSPAEAASLRNRLTALGEAHAAGL